MRRDNQPDCMKFPTPRTVAEQDEAVARNEHAQFRVLVEKVAEDGISDSELGFATPRRPLGRL